MPADKKTYLQKIYIEENPFSSTLKGNYTTASDGSKYSTVHAAYHPQFANLRKARSFHDVFLISPAGDLIYTSHKEKDFATNLVNGPWKNTPLAAIFRDISSSTGYDRITFSDFSLYPPSNNLPASFIAAPVFDSSHTFLGVLAFQMPIEKLNAVMHVTAGMGETGETYLVGQDSLMQSDSRFFSGRSILKVKVTTDPVTWALDGREGITLSQDYRDIQVISAYKPFDFLGTRWALIAEIDQAEVLLPVKQLNTFLTISGVVIAIVITFLGYLLANDLATPITAMTHVMSRLANNDLNVNISVTERQDEIGGMALALVYFKDSAIEQKGLRDRMSFMAKHDSLTQLPNRDFAVKQLQKMANEYHVNGKQFSIMFADLDGFKQVNDTYGHSAGDIVLKEVSARFKTCIRDSDILARFGGDEFLLIISGSGDIAYCSTIARKVISSLEAPFTLINQKLTLGVSIGIATFPYHTNEVNSLLKIADKAMYTAKHNGKNNFIVGEIDKVMKTEYPSF